VRTIQPNAVHPTKRSLITRSKGIPQYNVYLAFRPSDLSCHLRHLLCTLRSPFFILDTNVISCIFGTNCIFSTSCIFSTYCIYDTLFFIVHHDTTFHIMSTSSSLMSSIGWWVLSIKFKVSAFVTLSFISLTDKFW